MKVIEEFQGEFRFLSNFHPSPVWLDGMIFPTVEHAYQACKTLDTSERAFIRSQRTPGDAKRAGRKVTLRPDWEEIKERMMLALLMQKFSKDPLRSMLLSTGDARLEEGNMWRDTFWGVCPPGSGNGKNRLGVLLMRVRADLQHERQGHP